MIDIKGDGLYGIWSTNVILADCLRELGFKGLANELHTHAMNGGIIDNYIRLAQRTAESTNNTTVLERLCFAGLIYG